jgi:hypothetical protein
MLEVNSNPGAPLTGVWKSVEKRLANSRKGCGTLIIFDEPLYGDSFSGRPPKSTKRLRLQLQDG